MVGDGLGDVFGEVETIGLGAVTVVCVLVVIGVGAAGLDGVCGVGDAQAALAVALPNLNHTLGLDDALGPGAGLDMGGAMEGLALGEGSD